MPFPSGCDSVRYEQYRNYTLLPQRGAVGDCWITPIPTCELAITSNTITNVTIRGESDGEIDVSISGATGSTVLYYLNGVLQAGSGNTGNSFTGLSAGYYTVAVEEGECYVEETYIVADGAFRTGDFTITEPGAGSDLVAANNPIPFTIQTQVNSLQPVRSKTSLKVIGTISDGDTIKFQLEYPQTIDVTLTAKGFPDRDEYFLASVTNNASGVQVDTSNASDIAQSIGESIEKNVELSRLYDVYVNSDTVTLTAKEANGKLDLNTDTVIISTTAITQSIVLEGQARYDGQIVENYSLYADVYVYPNAQWEDSQPISRFQKATQLELPFSSNNIHRFDLSSIIKNYVTTPKLDWNLTSFTTVNPMLAEIRVVYGEKYPLVPNTNTKKSRQKGQSTSFYAINSALQWEEINNMSTYTGELLHNLKANFDAEITTTGSSKVQILVDDYLYDTGNTTGTTDIKFKFTVDYPDAETGQTTAWQSSPFVEFTDITYGNGSVYVSGSSNGVKVQYRKYWWAYTPFDYSGLEGFNPDPSIKYSTKFLTNKPTVLDMQRDASDWLFIVLPRNYGRGLKVKADLFFHDGTSVTGQTLYNVFTGTSNAGGVFMFGSGYEQLGLEAYETSGGTNRRIRRVDFALYQNDSLNAEDYPFSEVRSYRYDIDEQPSTKELAFLNRLGTYDTFTFVGEIVENVTRETGSFEIPLNVNSDGSIERGFKKNAIYRNRITKVTTCNSGWINGEHRDWLVNDLLSSNVVYDITEDAEHYVTVEMQGDPEKSSNENLYQVNVTITKTIFENNVGV